MLGFSGSEILVVGIVAIMAIGPKEIPGVMYQLGRVLRRAQYIRFAFSQQFDDFMKAHDLDELRRGVNFEAPETDEESIDAEYHVIPAKAGISKEMSPKLADPGFRRDDDKTVITDENEPLQRP